MAIDDVVKKGFTKALLIVLTGGVAFGVGYGVIKTYQKGEARLMQQRTAIINYYRQLDVEQRGILIEKVRDAVKERIKEKLPQYIKTEDMNNNGKPEKYLDFGKYKLFLEIDGMPVEQYLNSLKP